MTAVRGDGWQLQAIGAPEGTPQPDAYLDWALATGFAYYGADVQWLPVLLELQDGVDAHQFAQLVSKLQKLEGEAQEFAAGLRVPPFFAAPPGRLAKSTQFIGVLMQRPLLEAVRAGKEKRLTSMICRFEVGHAMAVGDPAPDAEPEPVASVSGPVRPQVVVAVIDDGIPFAQDRLLAIGGSTRVEYFWDQLHPFGPPFWGFGREFRKHPVGTGLDARMAAAMHNGLVDEDELYRDAGFTHQARRGHKPLAARCSHGAHVADLACFDHTAPLPGQRPVIAVQLPPQTVADTSGATLRPQVFLGIVYAIWRADAIAHASGAKKLGLLVNASYGLMAGPHDGSDLFERALDALLAACDPAHGVVEVLLPSGNNHLSRCHARFDLAAGGGQQTLHWRVLPDDLTESWIEIRLPAGADQVTLTIAPPGGLSSQTIGDGFGGTLVLAGAALARVHYPSTPSAQRVMLTLLIAPTASVDGSTAVAPAGLWTLTLQNNHSTKPVPEVHAWIQRDDTAPGYPRRGRQSFFDDKAYAVFDHGGRAIESDTHPLTAASCIRREGTHNALATGRGPVVVGAFRRSDGAAAPYSAGGPLPPPGRGAPNAHGPEAMLPGDDAPSLRGVLGAGTRSGSCVAMNGTSVATAQATRALARLVAAGPLPQPTGRGTLFQQSQNAEIPPSPPWPKPQPAPQRGGGGRLDEPSTRPPR